METTFRRAKHDSTLPQMMLNPDLVAYIKRVDDDDANYFAIYSSDGRPIGVSENRDMAWVIVRQKDLIPVDVH